MSRPKKKTYHAVINGGFYSVDIVKRGRFFSRVTWNLHMYDHEAGKVAYVIKKTSIKSNRKIFEDE